MSMNWQDLITQAEEGGGFDALPEGPYEAVVSDAVAKNATTGKQMIVATFDITAGPYKGRKVWNNFVISKDNPNALKWFFQHMKALGLGADFFAHNPSLEAVAAQLKGKTCTLQVAQKTYQGETRNEVKKITSSGGAPASPGGFGTAAPTPTPQAETPTPTPAPTPETPAQGAPPAVPF